MKQFLPAWMKMPYREDPIFGIFFLSLILVPLAFFPLFIESYETAKYPLFLLLASIGMIVLVLKREIIVNRLMLTSLGILLVFYTLSTAFSLDVVNSLVGLLGRYTNSLYFIFAFVFYIILVWNAIKNDENRRLTILRVIVFDGVAIAILGLFQTFGYAYYGGTGEEIRTIIPSFTGNQNFSSMFLVAVVPAIILLWNQTTNKSARYYYVVAAFLVVLSVIMSGSRGAILGMAISCIIFAATVLIKKFSFKYIFALAAVALTSSALYFAFTPFLRSSTQLDGLSTSQYTVQFRYTLWGTATNVIEKYPFFGTGTGNFPMALQDPYNSALASNDQYDDLHNLPIHIGATVGLPALAVFLFILGLALYKSRQKLSEKDLGKIWVLSSLPGVIVAACFNPVSIAVWALLGVLIACGTSYNLITFSIAKSAKVLLGAVAIFLSVFSVAFVLSEGLYLGGLAMYRADNNDRAVQMLRLAVFFNPVNTSASQYLASAQISKGVNPDDVTKTIDKMVQKHPNDAGAYKKAGDLNNRLYIETGDIKFRNRMDEDYARALSLAPLVPNLFNLASYGYFTAGEYGLAIDAADKGIIFGEETQNFYAYILKAKIYLSEGKKDLALQALERASKAGTDNNLYVKNFINQVKNTSDVKTIQFPVYFPPIKSR